MKRCCCLLLTGVLALADLRAQEPTVFRSAAVLVSLNVVVTDSTQRFVDGLSSGDFAVLEDGVPQDVSFFAAESVPLDLAILVDTSGSMFAKMPIVKKAAREFTESLKDGDRVMVVDIKQRTSVLHPLGEDLAAARTAIERAQPSGTTALYSGLYLTYKELARAKKESGDQVRRQAVVVLTDGADTSSLLTFEDVMDEARRAGIATYTITVRRPDVSESGAPILSDSEFAMKSLAQETGARAFFPSEILELNGVYGSIAHELASQYALAYTPKDATADGGFRRIQVQVTDRPDVRTRTRSGYVSPRRAGNLE